MMSLVPDKKFMSGPSSLRTASAQGFLYMVDWELPVFSFYILHSNHSEFESYGRQSFLLATGALSTPAGLHTLLLSNIE